MSQTSADFDKAVEAVETCMRHRDNLDLTREHLAAAISPFLETPFESLAIRFANGTELHPQTVCWPIADVGDFHRRMEMFLQQFQVFIESLHEARHRAAQLEPGEAERLMQMSPSNVIQRHSPQIAPTPPP